MRTTVIALVLTFVAAIGMDVPTAAAAISDAKIVIVVGAVESRTSSYRASGDAIYAEAIKYSTNVRKVYSPNATWSKVKAAIAGANIVVYLGHGNGYPSKYSTSPRPSTQNGFGLNEPTNPSDSRHKYYGEQYIDDVKLAPNAIVLLNRLCYASGNAEPGDPEPSLKIARSRVDNYAAGFIRAGAKAVIADGHQSVAGYIRALFTTNQTIDQLWRSTMSYGHIRTFGSTRSSGFTGYTDPKTETTGYYRSMVAKPSVTTREITGVVGDTGVDPISLTVPGRASVRIDGAELLSPVDLGVIGTLPLDTRLALVSRPTQTSPEGWPLLEVEGLDDASVTGYVRAANLQPRDSAAPVVLATEMSASTFSPNDDGKVETTTVRARFSEAVTWIARFKDAGGTVLAEVSGSGAEAVATWDGLDDGAPVADGTYSYTVVGRDAWANAPASRSGTVRVDTVAPTLSAVSASPSPVPWFAPNGDGYRDTYTVKGSVSETGRVTVRVKDGDTVVRTFSVDVRAGAIAVTWNGRNDAGAVVPDGRYDLELSPKDAVHNAGTAKSTPVVVSTILGSVAASVPLFYPHDGDALAPRTTLSFRLAREATVTWTLRSASGAVVATFVDGETLPAGSHSRVFDGRRPNGTMLPRGVYRSFVSVSDGTVGASQAATFEMNAFSMRTSDRTPRRGQKVSVTVVSAEALDSRPRLFIVQPGKTTWSVAMKRIAYRTYKATFTIRTGGSSGTITYRAKAVDSRGRVNRSSLSLPLR